MLKISLAGKVAEKLARLLEWSTSTGLIILHLSISVFSRNKKEKFWYTALQLILFLLALTM
jgi:hypothetical protein